MSRYIDADALKEWIDEYVSVFKKSDVREIKGYVEHQPTIEPRRGEWIAVDSYSAFGGSEEQWEAHGNPIAFHYCSNCKEQVRLDEFGEELLTNFCPMCGANMNMKKADGCKTENSSEKPNNCEQKNYCDDCLYTDTCDSKEFFYACTSKATISKMEQVEDEPQTERSE